MKKQLPTDAITNELSGASVFFQSKTVPAPPAIPSAAKAVKAKSTLPERSAIDGQATVPVYPKGQTAERTNPSSARDDVIPRHHATVTPSDHESQPSSNRATIAATTVERIRKTVKQYGKEAATHRFTLEEKRLLADIVYTYERRGVRTSENEITRIAINWLILDYQANGEQSVLARLLERLHG